MHTYSSQSQWPQALGQVLLKCSARSNRLVQRYLPLLTSHLKSWPGHRPTHTYMYRTAHCCPAVPYRLGGTDGSKPVFPANGRKLCGLLDIWSLGFCCCAGARSAAAPAGRTSASTDQIHLAGVETNSKSAGDARALCRPQSELYEGCAIDCYRLHDI